MNRAEIRSKNRQEKNNFHCKEEKVKYGKIYNLEEKYGILLITTGTLYGKKGNIYC